MVSSTLGGWGEASRGRTRGERVDAVSPTGSTHQQPPMRVTNDRVAASRARLHDGHKAPVSCRPRTYAGRSRISPNRAAVNTLLSPSSRVARGRARRKGCMDSFHGRDSVVPPCPFSPEERQVFTSGLQRQEWQLREGALWSPTGGVWLDDSP